MAPAGQDRDRRAARSGPGARALSRDAGLGATLRCLGCDRYRVAGNGGVMSAHALLVEPFETLAFMRAALVACLALALTNGAVGTLLVLRRMSLDGDVLGHAVMPGAAIGFLYAGPSPMWLSLGGLASGFAVAALAGALEGGGRRGGAARCRAGRVLSGGPVARRSAGGVAWQQCRCHARAVRHRAGDRPTGVAADCSGEQRDSAGDRGVVSTSGRRRLRSRVSSRRWRARAVSGRVPCAGGDGAGGEFPGVWHSAGNWPHAAAGCGGAVLGIERGSIDGAGDRLRIGRVGCGTAGILSWQSPV